MADYYCLSSSIIPIPPEKRKQAQEIINRVAAEIEAADDGPPNYTVVLEEQGVWIYHEENFSPDHAEQLVSALVEELDLPGIHVVSWAYTCSKPRLDDFGGGAFAVKKGKGSLWVNADTHVRELMEKTEQ